MIHKTCQILYLKNRNDLVPKREPNVPDQELF